MKIVQTQWYNYCNNLNAEADLDAYNKTLLLCTQVALLARVKPHSH